MKAVVGEAIIRKIIEHGKAEAEKIIKDAEVRAKQILESARAEAYREAAERVNSIKSDAEVRAAMIRHTAATKAKIMHRLKMLEEKNRMIEDVFKVAWEELAKFTRTDRYLEVLKNLILEAALSIGGGRLRIVIPQHHGAVIEKINLQDLAKIVEERTGNKTDFEVTIEPLNVSGGVIVETLDGRIMFDNTFEGRMKRMRKDIVREVGLILFSKH